MKDNINSGAKENVKDEGGGMADGWVGVRLSRSAQLFKSPEARRAEFPGAEVCSSKDFEEGAVAPMVGPLQRIN